MRASSIEEGLTPTMVEREQPQLLLISTAHRLATSLMLGRRQVALGRLEDGDGDLLIEWSAPTGAELDDLDAWRLASPHWTPRRERLIAKQLEALRTGELDDPEEPDPEESFQGAVAESVADGSRRRSGHRGVAAAGAVGGLAEPVVERRADLGGDGGRLRAGCRGRAVATVLEDGRIEVDGWLCPDWDAAVDDVAGLGELRLDPRAPRRCVVAQPDADATWFPNRTRPAAGRPGWGSR